MANRQHSSGTTGLLKQTFSEFTDDEGMKSAAALAYYTVFALPPLLVLVLMIAGVVIDPQQLQGSLKQQMQSLLGPQAAQQVQTMIQSAQKPGQGGTLAMILGIAALLFGATGAFVQLQSTLNEMWEVEPDPELGGVQKAIRFISKRVLSLGMILVIAFLLLVALVISSVLSAAGSQLTGLLPGPIGPVVLWVLNVLLSLALFSVLFAAMFKVLPDAKISWHEVWVGGLVTALLFVVGKFLIGFYIGQTNPGSAYGAAGSMIVVLLWIYYSSIIVFLGAEFTQVHVRHRTGEIKPAEGAVKVAEEKKQVR